VSYLAGRLKWAGGDVSHIFTPEAVDIIAHVSDGNPRCINQLCDHSLLLAYVGEQRPAGADVVLEALEDLKQLPLHWNDAPLPVPETSHRQSVVSGPVAERGVECEAAPAECDDSVLAATAAQPEVVEFGNLEIGGQSGYESHFEIGSPASAMETNFLEFDAADDSGCGMETPLDFETALPVCEGPTEPLHAELPTCEQHQAATWQIDRCQFEDEKVVDHYAALDARRQVSGASGIVWNIPSARAAVPKSHGHDANEQAPPPNVDHATPVSATKSVSSPETELPLPEFDSLAGHSLDQMSALLEQALAVDDPVLCAADEHNTPTLCGLDAQSQLISETLNGDDDLEEQIGVDLLEVCLDTQQAIADRINHAANLRSGDAEHSPGDNLSVFETPRGEGKNTFDVIEPEPPSALQPVGQRRADGESNGTGTPEPHNDTERSHRPYGRLFSELRRRQRQGQ
jgi:hypothetical protein